MKYIAIAALIGYTDAAKITGCTIVKGDLFTDKECATAADPAAATADEIKLVQTGASSLDDACATKTKGVCDATGVGQKTYTDDDCKTEATEQKGFTEWGKCVAFDGTKFVKWSDASFLKAGAAAVLAMVATQY